MRNLELVNNQEEIEDPELNWEEADAYRRMLLSALDRLVSEGIFTRSEADAWEGPAEACGGHAEWVKELLEKLGEYENSGEEVMGKIEELLKSLFFSKAEAAAWLAYAAKASYQEKKSLIGLLVIEIDKRRRTQEELARAKTRSVEGRVAVIQNFISSGKLDEAYAHLSQLNSMEYQVSYIKLSKDLDNARMKQAYETIAEIMPKAA